MNVLPSYILQILSTSLIWFGFAPVLFLLILKWEVTMSGSLKDFWRRDGEAGLAQVTQAAAYITAMCFKELC